MKAVIVETEAYKAPLDKGCHAYNSTSAITQTKKHKKQNISGLMEVIYTSTPSTCLLMFV